MWKTPFIFTLGIVKSLWDGHGDLQGPRDRATIMGQTSVLVQPGINGGIMWYPLYSEINPCI